MKPNGFLKAAAVMTALLAIGHQLGKPWIPSKSAALAPVAEAMRSHSLQVYGAQRTLMDFYVGFGLSLTVDLLLQAVLLWVLAGLVERAPAQARTLTIVCCVANVAVAVIAGVYLFVVPVVMSGVVAVCLGLAAVASWPQRVGA
jgi:hypothetical protein